jgi:DNA replication protein DnaC
VSSIRTRYLDDEDAERLYAEHPDLGKSPDEYCPTCNKTGKYRWRGEEHECDCVDQLQLLKHYLHAGIGMEYQRLDWDDFQGDPQVQDELISYVDNPLYLRRGRGLVISGTLGSGKTMLANLVLKEFIKRGKNCYATTYDNAIEMFTAGWRGNIEEKQYWERRFLYSEVLLLDDVGREQRNRMRDTMLDSLLRQRMVAGRVTLITSDMSEGELRQDYNAAIFSKLQAKAKFFYLSGKSFYEKASQREQDEIDAGEMRPLV